METNYEISHSGKTFIRLNPDYQGEVFTVPDGVQTIDANAFSECNYLTEVILPPSLKTIRQGAFSHCHSLMKICIPDQVTVIPEECFLGCGLLSSVELPKGLKRIDDYAFYYCLYLTHINLGPRLEIIGEGAFSRTPLASVNIPASVRRIDQTAFAECPRIVSISVDSKNEKYDSYDGNIIVEKSTYSVILGCKNSILPERVGVRVIASGAFCRTPKILYIPGNIIRIESYAFDASTYDTLFDDHPVSRIWISDGVETIEEMAFFPTEAQNYQVFVSQSVKDIGGQSSKIEMILDPRNPYFDFDQQGENIVSLLDKTLVWGKLKSGHIGFDAKRIEGYFYDLGIDSCVNVPNSLELIDLNHFKNVDIIAIPPQTKIEELDDEHLPLPFNLRLFIGPYNLESGEDVYSSVIIPKGASWLKMCEIMKGVAHRTESWLDNPPAYLLKESLEKTELTEE